MVFMIRCFAIFLHIHISSFEHWWNFSFFKTMLIHLLFVLILMGRGLILQRSNSLTLIGPTIFENVSISIQCLLLYRYTYISTGVGHEGESEDERKDCDARVDC